MRARPSNGSRKIAVGNNFARFKSRHVRPNVDLQRRALEMERQVEANQTSGKVRAHLTRGFPQQRVAEARHTALLPHEVCGNDSTRVARYGKRNAERRRYERANQIHGYNASMDEKNKTFPVSPAEKAEIKKEAEEAREGDEKLDDYDKQLADSFPASDPPTQP